jgi:Xaa-Pro aminopeptidase
LKKLVESMKRNDLDALILQQLDNVRYVTDEGPLDSSYFQWLCYLALVLKSGEHVYLCPSWDQVPIKRFSPWIKNLRELPITFGDQIPIIMGTLRDYHLEKARVGIDYVVTQLTDSMRENLPATEIVDATEILSRTRGVKTDEELKVIEEATKIGEIGMRAALDSVKEGERERDVAAAAHAAMRREGAEHFPTFVQSGYKAAIETPSMRLDKRMRYGELVVIDVGCTFHGYIADFTRTTVIGRATKQQREIYRLVLDSLQESSKALRPGVSVNEADSIARGMFERAGFKYPHMTGHGIGLNYHEYPIIGDVMVTGRGEKFESGMVCNLEPGIYPRFAGKLDINGGVRLEDTFLITQDGHQILSKAEYCPELL